MKGTPPRSQRPSSPPPSTPADEEGTEWTKAVKRKANVARRHRALGLEQVESLRRGGHVGIAHVALPRRFADTAFPQDLPRFKIATWTSSTWTSRRSRSSRGDGPDPVPRARRRQPRADGLEHAEAGRPAAGHRVAARRHRAWKDYAAQTRARWSSRRQPGPSSASAGRSRRTTTSEDPQRTGQPVFGILVQPRRRWPDQLVRRSQVRALQPGHLPVHESRSSGRAARRRPVTCSPTVPRPKAVSWRSAATCWSRSCPGRATTSRTRSSSSESAVREDKYTSIHIEEFEIEARDTKLGPEEITRDSPTSTRSR